MAKTNRQRLEITNKKKPHFEKYNKLSFESSPNDISILYSHPSNIWPYPSFC